MEIREITNDVIEKAKLEKSDSVEKTYQDGYKEGYKRGFQDGLIAGREAYIKGKFSSAKSKAKAK